MLKEISTTEAKNKYNKIVSDLTRPLKFHYGFKSWILTLCVMLVLFAYAYFIQLRDGLGVTSLHDYVSWGLYLSNFVFWVATSLIGMLISSVMGLLNIQWARPIQRIAEIVAFGFVAWAGMIILWDMGRPDRFYNILLHGRPQSPIIWDMTVVVTYTAISFLLLWLPMLPDLAILRNRMKDAPKWQKMLYNFASLGWAYLPEQYKLMHKSVRILLVLIVPVALAIHTVTSWLFASTLRAGWDSTIFGPYFVTGAFPAGVAAVLIMMYVFRVNYRIKDYLTDMHFDKMGKLLVLVSLVYLYFNINEFLVPGFKMRTAEGNHLEVLLTGKFAPLFWSVQLLGLIIPIILLLLKPMRKPLPLLIISIFVLVGAYFKRYLIVIPTMLHPYLPIQNYPENYSTYFPTGIEVAITGGAIAGTLLTITILAKLFPVVPISETAEDAGISHEQIGEFEKQTESKTE